MPYWGARFQGFCERGQPVAQRGGFGRIHAQVRKEGLRDIRQAVAQGESRCRAVTRTRRSSPASRDRVTYPSKASRFSSPRPWRRQGDTGDVASLELTARPAGVSSAYSSG
jgi:hypothetical protein